MVVNVYIVVKGTNQYDASGAELTIVIDAKLTNAAAEAVAARHKNARVIKLVADKTAT